MNVTSLISSLPPEVWFVILGGVVSVVTQAAKKWLNLQSPKVILTLTSTLSLLVTIIPSLLASVSHNPSVLGQHAVLVIGAATLLYRYVIQPADTFLINYKQFKTSQTAAAPVAFAAPAPTPAVASVEATPAVSTNEFVG
jgi:hypothetical protein